MDLLYIVFVWLLSFKSFSGNIWTALSSSLNLFGYYPSIHQKQNFALVFASGILPGECKCCVFWPAFGFCAHPKAGRNIFSAVFQPFLFRPAFEVQNFLKHLSKPTTTVLIFYLSTINSKPQFIEFSISVILNFFWISIFQILEWVSFSTPPPTKNFP